MMLDHRKLLKARAAVRPAAPRGITRKGNPSSEPIMARGNCSVKSLQHLTIAPICESCGNAWRLVAVRTAGGRRYLCQKCAGAL